MQSEKSFSCAGCGYQLLTEQGAELCPECGESIASSSKTFLRAIAAKRVRRILARQWVPLTVVLLVHTIVGFGLIVTALETGRHSLIGPGFFIGQIAFFLAEVLLAIFTLRAFRSRGVNLGILVALGLTVALAIGAGLLWAAIMAGV